MTAPMTREELLPCPFCKCPMMFRKALWPSDGCVDAIIHANPADCGVVEFSDGSIDESIIARWNARHGTAQSTWQPTEAQINSACLSYRHDFGMIGSIERALKSPSNHGASK